MVIDLNADVGESYGAWVMGADAELMPLITSANVACGAHAGDPLTMARTVALAKRHDVTVGAHPGYPDRDGFGRRDLQMSPWELEASLLAQLGALWAIARDGGVPLTHVKPHGALYNRAAVDQDLATSVAGAVARFPGRLTLVGLAGSALVLAGLAAGLPVADEAFADRAYEPDGSLRPRSLPGAVHTDPAVAAAQAVSIARDGRVRSHDGSMLDIRADTICIHGDTPGAAAMAQAVRQALAAAGIDVRPLGPGPRA
ncbi:MAG: LamB/YcsF family protein [Chloroflexi bacterium]|nr:LamB/YcsF family protein [Chloroflexota bacterium]